MGKNILNNVKVIQVIDKNILLVRKVIEMIKNFIVFFLIVALGFSVWFLTKSDTTINLLSKATKTKTEIIVSPTKIGSNDSYEVEVKVDGKPYTGFLDYDLSKCDINFSLCDEDIQDEWKYKGKEFIANDGKVKVPNNLSYPEGFYLVRFKPRGAPDDQFSNFDLQLVSNEPSLNTSFPLSAITIPMPPRGSYSILENRDSNGQIFGYTRIDVETDTDPKLCGGDVWRYTKTTPRSYWNPNTANNSTVSVLRWCVKESMSSLGLIVRAISGEIYDFDGNKQLINIKVEYPNSLNGQKNQAFLGGFVSDKEVKPWEATADSDMPYHYMLYPLNRRIPANLSDNPITMVDIAVGHPLDGIDTSADVWHVEMLAPRAANSLITFRQVESGFANRFKEKKWILTEDWTFNSSGLFTMIQQWWRDTPKTCWSPPYQCETGENRINAKIIESYVPDSQPLILSLSGSGQLGSNIIISNGESYELIVKKADGTNYSGFLEIGDGQNPKGIWRDASKRPIYVSAGSVIIPAEAYGNAEDFVSSFSVRPYLTNSSINSLVSTADWGTKGVIPNASTAKFSNQITLKVGNPLPIQTPSPTITPTRIPTLTPTATLTSIPNPCSPATNKPLNCPCNVRIQCASLTCSSGKCVPELTIIPTEIPTATPTRIPTPTFTKIPSPAPTNTPSPTPTLPLCTQCPGKPEAKSKGDADCSGSINLNDVSIWRSEFISGGLGSINKNNWHSDFNCDGKVNIVDASIWRSNFNNAL